jgi:2-oxoglutarate-Fe(II)-dependent oxygenase superfamily protein
MAAKMTKTDRTTAVLSSLRCNVSLTKSLDELLEDYRTAQPFPHVVLDNLFSSDTLDSLLEELPPASSPKWVNERHDRMIKSNLRSAVDLSDQSFLFAATLHSASFLYFISEITGIQALLPDPYLSGAGYHVIPSGGKFDVHADRNMDHFSGLERRLAMLVYLNKAWEPQFGGQLELWNQDATRCEKVIEPIFNRTVIFEIADKNFHAVQPVNDRSGRKRISFAVYYHTVGRNVAFHSSLFAPEIYQGKGQHIRQAARELLPPVLFRGLKRLKSNIQR